MALNSRIYECSCAPRADQNTRLLNSVPASTSKTQPRLAGTDSNAGGSWIAFAFWSGLLLLGQISALQLIDAGKTVHYQHYRRLADIIRDYAAPAGLLGIQIVLVLLAVLRDLRRIRSWLRRHFSSFQLALLAALIVISGATVSQDIGRYIEETIVAAVVQLAMIGNSIQVALSAPPPVRGAGASFLRLLDRPLSRRDPVMIAAVLWAVLVPLALNFLSYDAHPHLQDEVPHYVQARTLAAGKLAVPAPPVPEAFTTYLLEVTNSLWYGVTPFGWPAIFALGFLVGAPSVVNPLLAGLSVLFVYLFLIEYYDRRFARLAALLMATSPWLLFLAMSFMNHLAVLAAEAIGAYATARFTKSCSIGWALVAGAAVGFIGLTRPLDGLICAVILALWAAIALLPVRVRPLKKLTVLAACAAALVAVSALVLPYNAALTGNPLTFPLTEHTEKVFGAGTNRLGFGPNRGFGWALDPNPGHSPIDALININLNGTTINQELLGWGTGSLILVFIAVSRIRRLDSDLAWLASIAVVVGAYSLYFFSGGPDFAARYWFVAFLPLIALSARGLTHLFTLAGKNQPLVAVAAGLLVVSTVLVYLPWRAIDKYKNYLGMTPGLRKLAEQEHFGRSLVLVRGESFPDYASAVVYTSLDFRAGETLFAFDSSPEVRQLLLKAYPDREIWVVNGPSLTGSDYKVVQRLAAGGLPRP